MNIKGKIKKYSNNKNNSLKKGKRRIIDDIENINYKNLSEQKK